VLYQLRALSASVVQQWKQFSTYFGNLGFFLATIPMAVIYTWIAMQRGDHEVLSYLSISLPLMTVWSGVAFRIGYTLSNGRHPPINGYRKFVGKDIHCVGFLSPDCGLSGSGNLLHVPHRGKEAAGHRYPRLLLASD
jgi:hypothetical protein